MLLQINQFYDAFIETEARLAHGRESSFLNNLFSIEVIGSLTRLGIMEENSQQALSS